MSMRWLPNAGEHSLDERDAATAVASLRASIGGGCRGAGSGSSGGREGASAMLSSRMSTMSEESSTSSIMSTASSSGGGRGGGEKRSCGEMTGEFWREAGTEAGGPGTESSGRLAKMFRRIEASVALPPPSLPVPQPQPRLQTTDSWASQPSTADPTQPPKTPTIVAQQPLTTPAVAAAFSSEPAATAVATAPPTAAAAAAAAAASSTLGLPSESDDECGTGSSPNGDSRKLRPAPFFYYRDFSRTEDDDPLSPLTAPGRVPNFPAKMHAILSRPELQSVIAWSAHGRSFRVLKPRQFEVHVIPTYFEHSKFSSFVRQANGWGFKRMTQGPDRNCYYHEMFLRGMPHLCKLMTRPGASGKMSSKPEHEPDLQKISDMFPVRGCPQTDEQAILLESTVQGGPKARMPVHMGLQMVQDLGELGGSVDAVPKTGVKDEDKYDELEEDKKIAAKPSAAPIVQPLATKGDIPASAAVPPPIAPKPAAQDFTSVALQPIAPKLSPPDNAFKAAAAAVFEQTVRPKPTAAAVQPPRVVVATPSVAARYPGAEHFTPKASDASKTAKLYSSSAAPYGQKAQLSDQHQATAQPNVAAAYSHKVHPSKKYHSLAQHNAATACHLKPQSRERHHSPVQQKPAAPFGQKPQPSEQYQPPPQHNAAPIAPSPYSIPGAPLAAAPPAPTVPPPTFMAPHTAAAITTATPQELPVPNMPAPPSVAAPQPAAAAAAAAPTTESGDSVDGAAQFAAGFAAATALNGSAIQTVLQQALVGAATAVQETRALQKLQAAQIAQLQMQQAEVMQQPAPALERLHGQDCLVRAQQAHGALGLATAAAQTHAVPPAVAAASAAQPYQAPPEAFATATTQAHLASPVMTVARAQPYRSPPVAGTTAPGRLPALAQVTHLTEVPARADPYATAHLSYLGLPR